MSTVGVLALQGGVREHLAALDSLGVGGAAVKTPEALAAVHGLIIPGGESTTIGKLATRFGLIEPLRQRILDGMPVFGTCAGLIFLASSVTEGDQPLLGVLDIAVKRNAFGRQNESFETELDVEGLDSPFPAVFIRAPWVEKVGGGVEVLAELEGHPVIVRQGHVMAASFHPELTSDRRLHRQLVDAVERS